ncbi:cation transporter [Lachnoclostridium sp. Marseille-P6806]|uniref:cation transporter n=1 Tax=Lachnoclostridium sp. Marseille-P6806 TaxID=2364793 RepID=UPI0010306E05|nr:cation transporter [Lachnoclostridium sp. Marseille-P6806]
MKKKFKIDVDCAVCAAKLEEAIRRVKGVEECQVNFLTQKMMLRTTDEGFDEVLAEVLRTAKRVEPDAVIYTD